MRLILAVLTVSWLTLPYAIGDTRIPRSSSRNLDLPLYEPIDLVTADFSTSLVFQATSQQRYMAGIFFGGNTVDDDSFLIGKLKLEIQDNGTTIYSAITAEQSDIIKRDESGFVLFIFTVPEGTSSPRQLTAHVTTLGTITSSESFQSAFFFINKMDSH